MDHATLVGKEARGLTGRDATSPTASASGNPLVRWWRAAESTSMGGLLLGNVWPAYLFALPLGARVWGDLHAPFDTGTTNGQARLLQEVVTVAFLALIVVLFVIRRRTIKSRRADWVGTSVALLGTFLLNVVAFLPVEDTASTMALLGSSAVITVGTLWTIVSLATLGRCFGLLPEARGLIVRGPYRLVRHPVYVGELLAALGLLLAKPHPVVFALFAAFVVLQYGRTVYEERALLEAFPDEYTAYSRRVPRLVPGWKA
jgi:protein-S-isoprenylcysteine O-methyltransferase Ste14